MPKITLDRDQQHFAWRYLILSRPDPCRTAEAAYPACPEARRWLKKRCTVGNRCSLEWAWGECHRADWMLWMLAKMIEEDQWFPTSKQGLALHRKVRECLPARYKRFRVKYASTQLVLWAFLEPYYRNCSSSKVRRAGADWLRETISNPWRKRQFMAGMGEIRKEKQ